MPISGVAAILDQIVGPGRLTHGERRSSGRLGRWPVTLCHEGSRISVQLHLATAPLALLPTLERYAAISVGHEPYGAIRLDMLPIVEAVEVSVVHAHWPGGEDAGRTEIATMIAETCAAANRHAAVVELLGATLVLSLQETDFDLPAKLAFLRSDAQSSPPPPEINDLPEGPAERLVPLQECPGWLHGQLERCGAPLWLGPHDLPGGSGGHAITMQALICREVPDSPELWRLLRKSNEGLSLPRIGAFEEPGLPGQLSVFVSITLIGGGEDEPWSVLKALKVRPIASMFVVDLRPRLMERCGGSLQQRLEWVPQRRWSGSGSELRSERLIQRLESLPAEASFERVRDLLVPAHRSLTPDALAYALHLVLEHAERAEQAPGAESRLRRDVILDLTACASQRRPPGSPLSSGLRHRAQRLLGATA